jgi:stress-induced-phosphoprotein 1
VQKCRHTVFFPAVQVFEKLKKTKAELKKKQEEEYKDPVKGAEAKERGTEAFKAGDFPKAIKEYTEAIKRDPTNASYYANRSAAFVKTMNMNDALSDAEMAIKLDPTFVRGHCKKGNVHFATKEFHKALSCFQKALELDKENEEAKEGLRKTVAKINESSSSGVGDQERLARAMADPEIQAIMRDPMVSAALEDLQRDPSAARKVLNDPSIAPKIQKLIAAGVIGVR